MLYEYEEVSLPRCAKAAAAALPQASECRQQAAQPAIAALDGRAAPATHTISLSLFLEKF